MIDSQRAVRAAVVLMVVLLTTAGGQVGAAVPAVDAAGRPLPSLAPMLEKVMPGVVNIATHSRVRVRDNPLLMDPFFRRFFGLPEVPRERRTQSLGSGVIVDARHGYVLTNHHVIASADEITVTLHDGRSFSAIVVGADRETDVAVIKIEADRLTAIPMADSNRLRVGDFVVAIGNPFGLGQTVTSGIVSALGRSGLGIEGYEDFIQTDASINPGNSGGALVNLRGELVGINTAILAPSGGNVGIGFAIPINLANRIMDDLLRFGRVQRGRLGIATQDLTPELATAFGIDREHGAIVVRVVPGSVADKAGIRTGDVVLRIDGRRIRHAADLHNAVGLLPIGKRFAIEVWRDGEIVRLRAELVRPPAPRRVAAGDFNPVLAGAVISELTDESPLYGQTEGLLVVEVKRGSAAWRAGLRKGDVIVSINRRPVRRPEDIRDASGRGRGRLLMHIRRGDAAYFLLVE